MKFAYKRKIIWKKKLDNLICYLKRFKKKEKMYILIFFIKKLKFYILIGSRVCSKLGKLNKIILK